ncbi:hypothetical protein K7X08_025859 [Anisodus acutangulus]|uniref:Uncharacterized protein n=1 Tax=Anisodus acutangulus TaxID=402998 RepID=A0A9Q1L7W0_9SOLA|nr:hypothetical protein K7X08_025859 [Anisodus acutangulus]
MKTAGNNETTAGALQLWPFSGTSVVTTAGASLQICEDLRLAGDLLQYSDLRRPSLLVLLIFLFWNRMAEAKFN